MLFRSEGLPPVTLLLANPPWAQILLRLRQLRAAQGELGARPGTACTPLLVLTSLKVLESLERIQGLWLSDPPDEVWVLARRVYWGGPDYVYDGAPDKVGAAVLVWWEPPRSSPSLAPPSPRLRFLLNPSGKAPKAAP